MIGSDIFHIAIDGPVASGKGTVARELGERLGIAALDTGALYRAVGYYLKQRFDNIEYNLKVKQALDELDIKAEIIGSNTHVFINGVDITDKIRTPEMSKVSSMVATRPDVRDKVNITIRELCKLTSLIVDGRDIASVVLPDAKYKFFLTAKPKVRAERRLEQYSGKMTLKEMVREIKERDKRDSSRDIAPLKKVKDAIVIDNSDIDLEKTIELMLHKMKKV
ncbi:MAG: (d)CMP kinase [Firmicutes bacterium]|nr:(d)CMP kinase [Bacillota bacterium]